MTVDKDPCGVVDWLLLGFEFSDAGNNQSKIV